MTRRIVQISGVLTVAVVGLLGPFVWAATPDRPSDLASNPHFLPGGGPIQHDRYAQTNLVSDGFVQAAHIDPNLVNAWGVAFNPMGFVWVANAHSGTSTLYDGTGVPQSLVVQIPGLNEGEAGSPTGIIFNGTDDFSIGTIDEPAPARFIFATEEGAIAAWSPTVDLNHALKIVDNSSTETIYKGLAIANNGTGNMLFATDFHNAKIDVFDHEFGRIEPPGHFDDPAIPDGYAPFGIANIGGLLYVTYAKQDDKGEDDVPGPGRGFVNTFDANGYLIRRFVSRGHLNAPWGIVQAPAGFGEFGQNILIGNFGDGTINAYNISSGAFRGNLHDEDNEPISIEGLWGMAFGNGLNDQPTTTLFFASGPEDEEHGLYGRIDRMAQ